MQNWCMIHLFLYTQAHTTSERHVFHASSNNRIFIILIIIAIMIHKYPIFVLNDIRTMQHIRWSTSTYTQSNFVLFLATKSLLQPATASLLLLTHVTACALNADTDPLNLHHHHSCHHTRCSVMFNSIVCNFFNSIQSESNKRTRSMACVVSAIFIEPSEASWIYHFYLTLNIVVTRDA